MPVFFFFRWLNHVDGGEREGYPVGLYKLRYVLKIS
jgi:hypothetical protein